MAGKKIEVASFVMKLSDGNTIEMYAKKSKKAKKAADDMGDSHKKAAENVHTTDRRLKGASQQSSGASKNFSKMAQGIQGGLVPAYATLAATLFAVGAVFRAFQNAADFQALQASQEAYAASTGIMLGTVSKSLQEATGHQLDLQKAGASAAIMIAKGFNVDQINEVARASVAASQALGRNFEDTFNRIVQGTTKAEPELLDELGITLRLETATQKYADAVGKNRDELTTFERSQAVLNETLRQAEENFGAVAGRVPVNAFNKLGAVMTDLTMSFQQILAPLANFFANILGNNVLAAVAALGLFATSILSQVLPSMDEMRSSLNEFENKHNTAYENAKQDLEEYKTAQQQARQSLQQQQASGAAGVKAGAKAMTKAGSKSPVLERFGSGQATGTDAANLNKALKSAEDQYRKHGKIKRGIFKGTDIEIVRSMRTSFDQMNVKQQTFGMQMKGGMKRISLGWKVMTTKMKMGFQTAMAASGRAMLSFSNFANKVMGKAGVIGIIIMLFQVVMGMVDNIDKIIVSVFKGVGHFIDFILAGIVKLLEMIRGVARLLGFSGDAVQSAVDAVNSLDMSEKMGEIGQGFVDSAGITQFATSRREGASANDTFNQSLDLTKEKMQGINNLIAEQIKREKEGKELSAMKQAEFEANAVSTSGILGEISRLQSMATATKSDAAGGGALYTPEQIAEQQRAVQGLFDELKKIVPGLEDFGDVMSMDSDKLNTFLLQVTNAGQGLKTLDQILESTMSRRAESAKGLASSYFDKEVKDMKIAQSALSAMTDQTALVSDAEATKLATILGVSEDVIKGSSIKDVLAMVNAQVTQTEGIIQSQRDLVMSQLGTKLSTAKLGSRKDAAAVKMKEQIKIVELTNAEQGIKNKITELEDKGKTLKGEQKIANDELIKQEKMRLNIAEEQTKAYEESTTTAFKLQQTFATGLEKMFADIATGAATAKEAFKSLATLVLQQLVKIAAQQAAMATLNMMGFGLGMANGGIIPMAKGGYTRGYRSGGIATSPTVLVGEGRYNEAVVPLPDGRSIPVEMHGGGNSVIVNVNVNGQGAAQVSGNGGPNMEAMGKAIAALVQKEMVEQQRPGGVLSPYNGTGV